MQTTRKKGHVMITRATLAALSVPLLIACQNQGTAPGTVLATSTRDAQIEACANHVAATNALPRGQLSTVYGRATADGNRIVKVTAPNGNIFDCEVDAGYQVVNVTISEESSAS
jgi:hypothetical protein